MDWATAILSGLFTGIGVILSQRLMGWLDRHPITIKFKKTFEDLTNQGGVKPRKKSR